MSEEPGGNGGEDGRDGRLLGEETIGEILSSARESSGRSLDEISQETRIPVSTLEHLETDNFESLPAKVYVKGFLRTYAALLDLDVRYLLDKYEIQTGQSHMSRGDLWEVETEMVEERVMPPGILRKFALPAAILVVLVVILLRVDWGGGRSIEPPTGTPTAAGGLLADSASSDGNDSEPADEPSPETTAREVERTRPENLVLTLTAGEQDSVWFDLITVSADADTSFFDFILFPGQTRSFTATDAIVLRTVGNAGGFTSELNGRRLARMGERGEVVGDVRFTRDDLR